MISTWLVDWIEMLKTLRKMLMASLAWDAGAEDGGWGVGSGFIDASIYVFVPKSPLY